MRTDCNDIRQSLGLLLAGELTTDESTRVEIHLASCEGCRRARARFQRLDALLAAAPIPMPSRDQVQLMALRARGTSRRRAFVHKVYAAAAVIVVLLIPAATYLTVAPPRPLHEHHATQGAIDGFGGTFDLDF